MSTCHPEFTDYPLADLPAVPPGFADASWRNDACPKYWDGARKLVIWLGYANPDLREHAGPRFILDRFTDDETAGPIVDADEWIFILDALDEIDAGADDARVGRTIRQRQNRTTLADARVLLAENAAAWLTCCEFGAHLRQVISDAICDKWIARIGLGFHPDTRGDCYFDLATNELSFSPAEIAEYDGDMAELFASAADPYANGLAAMARAGLIEESN